MAIVTIPNRPAGSDARSIGAILANFDAITGQVNGNLDSTNIANSLGLSAGVNTPTQVSKGFTTNSGTGTRSNAAYGPLNDAADQVANLVVPSNALVAVWFQAIWNSAASGANGGRAAVFIGANQLQSVLAGGSTIAIQETVFSGNINTDGVLASSFAGLRSGGGNVGYPGDVTTGMLVGTDTSALPYAGGPMWIDNLAAGTYTISVQYRQAGGLAVTVHNRRLKVIVFSFS